ncbi:hypothetical protein CYMTET_24285 [Cymbomonas tetramitiformis]|uniref:Uncharacterized protein n=1 Tax=Cymbomonas tetramitiformis TaxID=36881 RepID=A0AAE0FW64_9CHLO|nr:hypothetical protein CYMTET_24285 [Cymbomonas tetramitiformis]
MVCTACGEWIRFLGNYNALPEVWECGLCAETCKEFEGTGLSILGTVMCGRCHEYRRALEIRAPLHPHPCHLGESVPLHMYKKVPADAARVHAVLNLRDLYEAWLLLHKAFSSAAWNPLDTQRRELFSGVAWETDEGHSLPTDQALNADIVLTESTAGYNTHMLYQKLGVECPGLQSVVISMLMILNAKKLGRLGGGNVGRSRGYLFFCEDSEIKVNKELQKMLDNPELLNMEFATKVAKKMTHDWDVSQRALVVRCDCEFQKGGSRKLSAPGMWDKRALAPQVERHTYLQQVGLYRWYLIKLWAAEIRAADGFWPQSSQDDFRIHAGALLLDVYGDRQLHYARYVNAGECELTPAASFYEFAGWPRAGWSVTQFGESRYGGRGGGEGLLRVRVYTTPTDGSKCALGWWGEVVLVYGLWGQPQLHFTNAFQSFFGSDLHRELSDANRSPLAILQMASGSLAFPVDRVTSVYTTFTEWLAAAYHRSRCSCLPSLTLLLVQDVAADVCEEVVPVQAGALL